MKTIIKFAIVFFFIMASSAQAHMFWVNSFESFAHLPGHTTVSLGWGHTLPIDDITNAVNARTTVEQFSLTMPDGKVIALRLPDTALAQPVVETADVSVFNADIACQKIALNKDSQKGNYLFAANTKPTSYTQYIDNKNRTRIALKPKDEIKDYKKVLFSVRYQAFAKSYLTLDKWVAPVPVGYGLEITPLTDLSRLKVGDMVEVDVRFYGKPLSYSPKSIEYITAFSPSFGLGKGFELFSYISQGKAQFEVQRAGQWVINVFHNEPVTEDGPLRELYGKVNTVNYGATLTFTVK